jgi:hypothetical protein
MSKTVVNNEVNHTHLVFLSKHQQNNRSSISLMVGYLEFHRIIIIIFASPHHTKSNGTLEPSTSTVNANEVSFGPRDFS